MSGTFKIEIIENPSECVVGCLFGCSVLTMKVIFPRTHRQYVKGKFGGDLGIYHSAQIRTLCLSFVNTDNVNNQAVLQRA